MRNDVIYISAPQTDSAFDLFQGLQELHDRAEASHEAFPEDEDIRAIYSELIIGMGRLRELKQKQREAGHE